MSNDISSGVEKPRIDTTSGKNVPVNRRWHQFYLSTAGLMMIIVGGIDIQ